MNNAINEIKNTLEGTNSRLTETEDRISEVEDKMVEINEAERKKEKRIKINEDNLRDLWDNVKHSNIWIIGVPEEEDKKNGLCLNEHFPPPLARAGDDLSWLLTMRTWWGCQK